MTARDSIVGVERSRASPVGLGRICECGAAGEHRNCWAQRATSTPCRTGQPGGDLRALVLAVLPAPSSNAVARRVPRKRQAVLRVLRELERDGHAYRDGRGWAATSIPQRAGIPQNGSNANIASCDHGAGEGASVRNPAGSR